MKTVPMEEVALESLRGPDFPKRRADVIEMKAQQTNRTMLILEGTPDETARRLVSALREEGLAV